MSSEMLPFSDKIHEVVLRDLQSMLRKSLGGEVQVVNYKTLPLLPPGENYASSMLKVDATIKRSKKSPEEQLYLVAKMLPPSEFQRTFFSATVSYNKEIFVFEKLINAYRKIEMECGIAEKNSFDILPKYYGARLSLKEESSEADDDAVLLMENLKTSGYYCMDRLIGLDLDHAKFAITELARFHALGIALKRKKPDLFKEAKEKLNLYPFVAANQAFEMLMKQNIETICGDPRVAEYADRVREKSKTSLNYLQYYEVDEPWESIIHGDFWVNNVMFHKENGKIDGIKFVDFQITQPCSPLKDLPYFLCASLSMDIIDNHFENLLNTYHATFVETLERIGCDASPFTRDNFYKQLRKDASDELLRCLLALKVFTLESPADFDFNKIGSEIFETKASNLFLDRAWKVVSKFVDMKWI